MLMSITGLPIKQAAKMCEAANVVQLGYVLQDGREPWRLRQVGLDGEVREHTAPVDGLYTKLNELIDGMTRELLS
jgi:hypothetical protein